MSNVLTLQSQLLTPMTQQSCTRTAVAHKRKANNKIDKGLKWFKGAPKKSSQKYRLLKSAPEDPFPLPLPTSIAARVVEFEIGGTLERLGVTEQLEIVEAETLSAELVEDTILNFDEDIPNIATPCSGRKPRVKSAKVKVKSKKNGKVQSPNLETSIRDTSTPSSRVALPEPSFTILTEEEGPVFPRPNAYIRYMEATQEELSDEVEYDLEEEDVQWLQLTNATRKRHGVVPVKRRDMEFMMDRLEKESYFQMQCTGMDRGPPIDDDAVCCICMDGECQNSNAILFCDMCNLAVHQDCYGVPYIPEGQWLCRKCLHSPSRAVECVLCPNKGGALKGTDDGRWAHVACAIWIPEVCFANTVFLEPIESISNIPTARWRLTCFICKQKGIGACIQCYKSSCYTAFHVTCAQQANLVMKMETVREMHMTSVIIKKTAYCNNHAPPDMLLERKLKDGLEMSSPRMKMKQTRKILAEKRDAIPAVLIPTIPKNRIAAISNSVNFPGKPVFMKRVMAYWKLKRQLRNGVPLLRRLQMASSAPNSKPTESKPKTRLEQQEQLDHYKSWVRLRQDLERARLLCEMIRKREKLKRELIYTKVHLAEMEVFPMTAFFLNILDEISRRDTKEIFHYPVDVTEVTDYLTKIKEPMDLSTMREKVDRLQYSSVEELEFDFNRMISNCLLYNDKGTIYYKTAMRIRAFGNIHFRKAKKMFQNVGYDGETGLHMTVPPVVVPSPTKNHTVPIITISESVTVTASTCKCSTISVCNNNCNRKTSVTSSSLQLPVVIPSSFTTYRSTGGDRVSSDSEDDIELNRNRTKTTEDESESEESSSASSSSSSSEESAEEDDKSDEEFNSAEGRLDANDHSSSSEDSSTPEVQPNKAVTRSGVVTRNSSNQPDSGAGDIRARGLRSSNRTVKSNAEITVTRARAQRNVDPGGQRDSDSDVSSSSVSSGSKDVKQETLSRKKRLRKRK